MLIRANWSVFLTLCRQPTPAEGASLWDKHALEHITQPVCTQEI